MRKPSTLQCVLVRFWVPLLLVVSICYANSAIATTEVSGNEENTEGKLVDQELAKKNPEVHDGETKFKGFFHPKPISKKPFFKKPIPTVKPKPIPVSAYKPVPKAVPTVKPIPKPVTEEKFTLPKIRPPFFKPPPFHLPPSFHKPPPIHRP